MTTTEDERSDCATGDCETGMYNFYVTFTGVEWDGLYLKVFPIYSKL